jgi:hypothetical protein
MGAPFVKLWMRKRVLYGQKRLGSETYNALKFNTPENNRQINKKILLHDRFVKEDGEFVAKLK